MKILSFLGDLPDNVLSRALKEGYGPMGWAFLFSLVVNVLFLAMPLYTYQVYGRVLQSQNEATLWILTFVTIGVFAVSSVVDSFRAAILINYGAILDQRVSGHILSSLFDAAVRGDPAARAQGMRDLDTFRQVVTGVGPAVAFDAPFMPIFLLVLFLIDPLVGVVTALGMIVLFVLALMQSRATQAPLKEANDAALRSYAFTETALRNSEVVRAMGMLPRLGAAWANHRAITIERGAEASERSAAFGDTIKAVRMGMQVLIVALGAYLILEGKIHSGMLFANMILAARALAPIEKIVGAWDTLNNGYRAHERLNALLAKAEPASERTSLPRPLGKLSVEAINFAPPGTQKLLLLGVSFAIEPGEVLGVVGPSGAGKSTLARLLMGVWKPNTGTVRLDGADVFSWDRADFGRHVGYLPQDTELFAGTIRDNIARFLSDVTDTQVIEAANLAGVHEMILRTAKGYDTEVGEGGTTLSVGQRQRVGLARAMLCNPAFMVLDEPNANLDADGEAALMKAVEAMKAQGSTIVVITHKINILRVADKMLLLRDGKVEAFGPRDQVMAKLGRPTEVKPVEPKPAEVRSIEGGR